MAERFITLAGTISVTSGTALVTGTGTLFSGRDRESALVVALPADAAPQIVGFVAAVAPRGEYDNLELPLVAAYNGPTLTNSPYLLVDLLALASGTTQAALFARFASQFEHYMGAVGNLADDIDWSLVFNNTLFVDQATRVLSQWRNGQLEPVQVVGASILMRGVWGNETTYARNDLVTHDGAAYVSNADDNLNHEPAGDDEWWTVFPLPSGIGDKYTISLSVNGKPRAGEVLVRHVFEAQVTFPAGLTGSQANSDGAATGEAEFSITKNGAEIGTVTFDTDDEGVFALASEAVFEAGDILRVVAPAVRDATLADLSITLAGDR